MQNHSILWCIEHIARELDVAVLSGIILAKKYHKNVKFELLSRLDNLPDSYHPSVILLPYCYSINDGYIKKCFSKWPNSIFVNLAWEQIFYNANQTYKLPRDYFSRQCVYHHAWSKKRVNTLKSLKIPSKHIFLNGHPAYKLYDDPYKTLFISRRQLAEEFGLDQKKKWVFFPENYSWFFYSPDTIKKILKDGQNEQAVKTMQSFCEKSFEEVIRWLDRIVREGADDVEVILPPRPTFSLSYFKEKLHMMQSNISDRIHVLKTYTVREWILGSDIIVSSFSTTLIEAALAKKSIYMLQPYRLPSELWADWYKYIDTIKTYTEFKLISASASKSGNYSVLNIWARKNFFHNSDPIYGLADIIGKLESKPLTTLINFRKEREMEEKTDSKLWNNQYFLSLGKVKNVIFGKKIYENIDDESIFDREVSQRLTSYRNHINNSI